MMELIDLLKSDVEDNPLKPKRADVEIKMNLLAHLFVSLPDHDAFIKYGSVTQAIGVINTNVINNLNNHLKQLDDYSLWVLKNFCEVLFSNDMYSKMMRAVQTLHQSDPACCDKVRKVLLDTKITQGMQIRYRQKMIGAYKVQKIKSMSSIYELNVFLLDYKKYARNFEVERTKPMSVSHVSGSLYWYLDH